MLIVRSSPRGSLPDPPLHPPACALGPPPGHMVRRSRDEDTLFHLGEASVLDFTLD